MGLTGILNVAKNGLVTHQLSLQTIGHNISNVNTRGYSKQDTITQARIPTPISAGPIGNGVLATDILRRYDQFITKTLFDKTSDMAGLDTRQAGLKLVEGVLNEVENNGLSELVNEFWTAWDDVANFAEGMPERTTLLQRAHLLTSEIRSKYDQMVKLSQDVDLNIDTSIQDINRISAQIAELNVHIVAAEAGGHSANDLRDQRDMLIKRLSELADINYFETKRGSYTVLIGQGSPLVEDQRSWDLELRGGSVYWQGNAGEDHKLTTRDIRGGELGGWLDLKSRVTPGDPTILTASVPNTSGGRPIRESTRWDAIDGVTVGGNFTIRFSGTDQEGMAIGPVSFSYPADGVTVGDMLRSIEAAFRDPGPPPMERLRAGITDDGRITLEDIAPGSVPISFQIEDINGAVTGLDLGKFDGDYPLNYTEQLNKWAGELIKAVNMVHSQGTGLVPLQEATATNGVIPTSTSPVAYGTPLSSRASGLAFSDIIKDGSFEIYLYDSAGDVIDADPSTLINEPYTVDVTENVTTLDDIRNAIGSIGGLSARIVDGRIVVGVDGTGSAAGFAFGNDSSGVLAALGINAFFTGTDASTIELDNRLVEDPRLVAAARVQKYGAAVSVADNRVMDPARPLDARIDNGTLHVELLDNSGNVHDSMDIDIDRATDSLDQILARMDAIDGIHAWIENNLVHIEAEDENFSVSIDDSYGGSPTGFLDFLGISGGGAPAPVHEGTLQVERSFEVLESYDTPVMPGTFSIDLLDSSGDVILTPPATSPPTLTFTVAAGDSLDDIAASIDAQDNISAQVIDGRLRISAQGAAERLYIREDSSGLLDFLSISTPRGGKFDPADNSNAIELRGLNTHEIKELDGATLNEFYHGLVGTVGIHSRGFQLDYDFARATVNELEARRDDVSGVSLDEEMSDLLKYQHAYSAAAKLIKAADEMFLTLLQTK